MNHSKAEVRGYTLFGRNASIGQRALAFFNDLCLMACVDLAIADLCRFSPILNIPSVMTFLTVATVYFLTFRHLGFTTPGEWICQLKRNQEADLKLPLRRWTARTRLYAQNLPDRVTYITSAGLTLASLFLSYYSVNQWILKHPLWAKSSLWEIKPFVPSADEWFVTPFFYAIGGWPKRFDDAPVLYTLPYENGPPHHFIGHVVASLDRANIKLFIEGPKTPELAAGQQALRDCFSGNFPAGTNETAYSCIQIKDRTLKRHLDEMRSTSMRNEEVKWFQITSPELTADNQTQGIYLRGAGKNSIQDRFILVNRNGTNQSIILNRPNNDQGERAFQLIQNSIASLRTFPDLHPGRVWINNELSHVRLDALNEIQNEEAISNRLEEIQVLLISSISVDPGRFESYFHLAGTSLMLAKKSISTQDSKNVSALENIRSAYRFAQDVAPNDPRTPEIQSYWLEARKF